MSFKDFPFLYEIKGGLGGSLYIFLSKSWFAMRCHLLIRTFLRLGTEGRYSVTNGNILLRDLFYFLRATFFPRTLLLRESLTRSLWLNSFIFSSNVLFEELVLRSLRASPLINPFLTPGEWQEENCVYILYWKASVGLKCVRTSREDSLLNLSPLYIHVSRKVISVADISAVNFMVGWYRCGSIPVSTVLRKSVTFFTQNIFFC